MYDKNVHGLALSRNIALLAGVVVGLLTLSAPELALAQGDVDGAGDADAGDAAAGDAAAGDAASGDAASGDAASGDAASGDAASGDAAAGDAAAGDAAAGDATAGDATGPASDAGATAERVTDPENIKKIIRKDFDNKFADFMKTLGKRILKRTRRSLALGPYLGVAPGLAFHNGTSADAAVQFGLALRRYDVPLLPSVSKLKDILVDTLKDALIAKLKAYITTGQEVSPEVIQRLLDEAWEEIKEEFSLKYKPKRFEKPSLMGGLEVTYMFVGGLVGVRGVVGFPVKSLLLSLGVSLDVDESLGLSLPIELSKPMFLSDSVRSPTVHFFLRGEFAVFGRDDIPDRVLLGARIALDVI